ncbi:MAG: carboxypeptidase regulatory-like domain-containing protein [Bryobacteraceae bacterium]|nr:carboxypeptidase regulatory-like domain-containing protein [Bryobacteraceae bacterium]
MSEPGRAAKAVRLFSFRSIERSRHLGNAASRLTGAAIALLAISSAHAASIKGTVAEAGTGAPLPGVKVTTGRSQAGVVTDQAGRFELTGLADGEYRVKTERTGYVNPAPLGLPVLLHGGRSITGLRIELAAEAVVSGRVLNEQGEPVLARIQIEDATSERVPVYGSSSKEGHYRVGGLVAGRYRIHASVMSGGRMAYAPSFYPAAADEKDAAVLELAAGQERDGLNLVLRRPQLFEVSGRYVGEIREGERLRAYADERKRGPRSHLGSSEVGGDGRFALEVPAGEIVLRILPVRWGDGAPPIVGLQKVSVRGRVENLVVSAAKNHTVRGRFRWAGRTDGPPDASFSLNPLEAMGYLRRATPDGRGYAIAGGVSPDRYAVIPEGLPAHTHVISIQAAGVDISQRGLDLIAGTATEFEMVIGRGGYVTGRVVDGAGRPVRGGRVTFQPTGPGDALVYLSGGQVVLDGNGRFEESIAPGEYAVRAWSGAKRTYRPVTVRVAAGERREVEIVVQ